MVNYHSFPNFYNDLHMIVMLDILHTIFLLAMHIVLNYTRIILEIQNEETLSNLISRYITDK